MVTMKIILETTNYKPGDEVTGFLEIECEKSIDAKRVLVGIIGEFKEKAKKPTPELGAKFVDQVTALVPKRASLKLLDHFIVLSKATKYPEGKHRVPFSFRLRDSGHKLTHNYQAGFLNTLLPSYAGMNAQISYTIYAKLELSPVRSFSEEIPVTISIPDEGVRKKPIRDAVYDSGASILDIEARSQLYCTGSPYELRFRSNSRHKITKIIFEIFHGESTKIGNAEDGAVKVLSKAVVVPEGKFGSWHRVVLPSHNSTVKTFFYFDKLRSYVSLGITVERYKQSSASTTIRLLSLRCPDTLKTPITKKLGSKVKGQNSCPHCSSEMSVGGMVRPDGFVICPRCFKKFKPESL